MQVRNETQTGLTAEIRIVPLWAWALAGIAFIIAQVFFNAVLGRHSGAPPAWGRALMGLAAGLAAIGDRAEVAYVSSTDVPLLHPAFVRRVVGALDDQVDVVLPEVGGFRQPLSAAYRIGLLSAVEELIAADRMRPAFLFERSRVLHMGEAELLLNGPLARLDPALASVSNLNEPADYERAHALPAPEVVVERFGPLAKPPAARRETVRAWSLGGVAAAVGLTLDEHIVAALNGDKITRDVDLPLVSGDTVAFMVADAGG